eukprot:4855801-Alexandrium_andersonii.AAC.1
MITTYSGSIDTHRPPSFRSVGCRALVLLAAGQMSVAAGSAAAAAAALTRRVLRCGMTTTKTQG